jgi:hypothetical protein
MYDRMVSYLLLIPVSIIILLLMTMVLLSLADEEPSNPVGSIPKVIFDTAEGETIITITSVGEHRYDEIHLNYSVGEAQTNTSAFKRYSFDINVSVPSFTLNVTVISGKDHYLLNCTVEVDRNPSSNVFFWIKEEDDNKASRHRSPYTILVEWRDLE